MYISEATRDALCNAGIWATCLIIGGMVLAVSMPWIIRKLKIASLHVLVICERICAAVLRLLVRTKKASLAARDERRQRIAEKVFERPVRWDRNVLQK